MIFKNRALGMVLRKASQMANVFESEPFNIDPKYKKLIKAMELSGFENVRAKLGKLISLHGKGALGLIDYADTWIAVPMEVVYYSMLGTVEMKVYCRTTENYQWGNESKIIYAEYSWKSVNHPIMRRVISNEPDKDFTPKNMTALGTGEVNFPPMRTLPVKVFTNNYDLTSDSIEFGVNHLLKEYDRLSSDFMAQYNKSKNLLYNNRTYTSNDGETLNEDIKDGLDVIEDFTTNSKAGGGSQIVSQSAGSVLNMAALGNLENAIIQYFGLSTNDMNQSSSGGAQKHSLEIVLKDQFSIDIVLRKQLVRESEWNLFFEKWCLLLSTGIVKVKLKLNRLTQAKLDYMDAAINQMGQKPVNNNVVQPAKEDTNAATNESTDPEPNTTSK